MRGETTPTGTAPIFGSSILPPGTTPATEFTAARLAPLPQSQFGRWVKAAADSQHSPSGKKSTVVSKVPSPVSLHPTTIPSRFILRHRHPARRHSKQTMRPDISSSSQGELKTAPWDSKRRHPHDFEMPSRCRRTSGYSLPVVGLRLRMGGMCLPNVVARAAVSKAVVKSFAGARHNSLPEPPAFYFFGGSFMGFSGGLPLSVRRFS
jgi:hypothetical protein